MIQKFNKKTLGLMLLGLSVSTVSAASTGFDPAQKLEEGKRIYSQSLANIASNRALLDSLDTQVKDDQAKIIALSPKTSAMVKDFNQCADFFGKGAKAALDRDASSLEEQRTRIDEALSSLNSDVDRYLKAQNCSQCDADIVKQTLKKYARVIDYDLSLLSVSKEDKQEVYESITRNVACSFDDFFVYNETSTFKELKGWYSAEAYRANVYVKELFKGSLNDALAYIAEKGCIQVNQAASRLGKPYSKLQGNEIQVNITYTWDFITGYDNVRLPDDTNPINIVQQAIQKH
jgi:hypothetical protein